MSPAARWLTGLAASALFAASALAAQPLTNQQAALWLQRMADSARLLPYEGVFVFNHGDAMQTMHIVNRNAGSRKESLLTSLDGSRREVICRHGESLSVVSDGAGVRTESRLSSRHFPDLLPVNAAALTNWYAVRLGEMDRVAGLDCRWLQLTPKDMYRWGYFLCAENTSYLPLKAMMVNESGKPLLQYAFTEVRIGANPRASNQPKNLPSIDPVAMSGSSEAVTVRQLPPGYTRVIAVKRKLPNRPHEVEHWVYSDGLTYISLFIEPATGPVETVRGVSAKGMLNLLTRQVGNWQVTVLGDAPWPAVEVIATSLAER
ncbi:MAG: MucB/RseB C-terminal domain-containing protein [Thiobacillaceae bacterium]